MQDVNKRRRISFSLSKLECGPLEINSREIRLHLPFSANWNKRDKVWKTGIHFKTDVFAAVAVVDAKAPWCNHGDGNVTRKVNLLCFKLRRAYSISFDSFNVGKFYRSWILKDCTELQEWKKEVVVLCVRPLQLDHKHSKDSPYSCTCPTAVQ